MATKFVAALIAGDIETAVAKLSSDVVLVSDGGGRVSAAVRPIEGPVKVLGFLQGLAAKFPDFALEIRELNHTPALVVRPRGQPPTIFLVDLAADGRSGRIWAVRNPDKTARSLAR